MSLFIVVFDEPLSAIPTALTDRLLKTDEMSSMLRRFIATLIAAIAAVAAVVAVLQ